MNHDDDTADVAAFDTAMAEDGPSVPWEKVQADMTRRILHRTLWDGQQTTGPVCACGWTPPPYAGSALVTVMRVNRHAAARNRLEARPIVYRVVPHGYCDVAAVLTGRPRDCWRVVDPDGNAWHQHYRHQAQAMTEATEAARRTLEGSTRQGGNDALRT